MKSIAPLVALLLLTTACELIRPNNGKSDRFSTSAEKGPIAPGTVDEASGLADSRTLSGHVWVQEDSNRPAEISLLTHGGQLAGRVSLPGIANRDWEDLGIGPGPQDGVSYLYLADIGDNFVQYNESYIYRFPEPKEKNGAVSGIERITFRYPDGRRDAETILVDPQTRDIFIVTKSEEKVRIYRLAYPQNTTEVTTAAYQGELPLSLVTGGSVSPDGSEILIRTYFGVSYWRRTSGQSLADAMQRTSPRSLVIEAEPQGEGIAFAASGNGFFTISERRNAPGTSLNFYKRQ